MLVMDQQFAELGFYLVHGLVFNYVQIAKELVIEGREEQHLITYGILIFTQEQVDFFCKQKPQGDKRKQNREQN